ncbi:chaperone, putative [Hepatocystis sp. ex Piliocolobus tephrosceles]|nr:chaperone, putative [Hepatocystis sp. ex Piliocolobus tephrosceles]
MKRISYILPTLWKHNIKINAKVHKQQLYNSNKRFFINENNSENKKCDELNNNRNGKIKKMKCHNCHIDLNLDVVPFSCQSCKALLNVDVFKLFNFFELFGIEANFEIDKNYLKTKFNDTQKIYHPDKHSKNPQLEKINEVSSHLNHAYKILSNDVDRALYLMKIQYNYKIPEEANIEDGDFLFEIFQVNEEINNPDADVILLRKQYKEKYEEQLEQIKRHFKKKDFENIVTTLKKLKFIIKILERLKNV